MSPSMIARPVACARAEAYAALASAFRLPTLLPSSALRRVITTLGHVMAWQPHPPLEEQIGALHLWLQEPSIDVPREHCRLFDESVLQALSTDLHRMADLCAGETRAWTMNEGGAARDCLLQEQSHLRSLDRSLCGISGLEVNEGLYAILVRIARQYVAFDERLVAALLVATAYALSEMPLGR